MVDEVVGQWAGFFAVQLAAKLPVHCGFLGKYLSGDGVEPLAEELQRPLKLLKQVHGVRLVEDADTHRLAEEADGFLFAIKDLSNHALVVKTADCMPVLMVGSEYGALIHSGWRGLAAGIIKLAAERLSKSEESFLTFIGPHASRVHYEVGAEVWEAFGERACGRQVGEKYLLDLAAIAANEIRAVCPNALVQKTDICTMTDARFHSYRRDGPGAGRNLSFVTGG